jgi:adenylate cyclase
MLRRLGTPLAVTLVAAAVATTAAAVGALDGLEGQAVDARFAVRGEQPVTDVAIVAIDGPTFAELGLRWPFPRSLHARAIDRLRRAGARQIAYDVQFTEPTDPSQDLALYDAVARARGVVLSTTEVDDRGRTNVLGGQRNLSRAGARAGHTGAPAEGDGVIRRIVAQVDGLESFALAAADEATNGRLDASAARDGRAMIDFHGPPDTVPAISFSSVLRGRFDRDLVRNRVVVVGATAPSLHDVHPTATSGGELMSGPELQANEISTVLRELPLRRPPLPVDLLAAVLLALIAPLASLRLRPLGIAATAAGALAAFAAAAQLLFAAGVVVAVAAPVLALVLGLIGSLGLRVAAEARERRRTREAFARFVPEPVVEELVDRDGGERRLTGRRLEATVMFCDLRGFTALAESLPAERVLVILDRFLTAMSEAVLDHGGTVVSYMGDGVMAVFGSPVERPDHARAAFRAAREMLGSRLAEFNDWLAAQELEPLGMGVGLNSGPVMSGTVGSERRLEYAAVGDTTNVAARIEKMTKEHGVGLLVSGATRAQLGDLADGLLPAGAGAVRGRSTSVELWAPMDELQAADPPPDSRAVA